MAQTPPPGYSRVSPYLFYEDVVESLEWLCEAFGFDERMRMAGPDGEVSHAEVELDGGVIMMGRPGPDYENPKRHGHQHQLVHVYVEDVDAHFDRARDSGATISSEPEDKPYGDRSYTAEDPEGHQWSFAQHIRDVSPEEMQQD